MLGNIFLCFDGCAQYLSSPTAPYLIASAYRSSSPPVLVACVRKPVDQAVSWWQYENNAMAWGKSMGLKEWNTALRSERYPPRSILEAIEFAKSEFVQNAYSNAEAWGRNYLHQNCVDDASNAFHCLFRLFTMGIHCLPPWAITWPAGQLSTIGRSGNYLENIRRYNSVFSATFGIQNSASDRHSTSSHYKIGSVHTVPIEYQSDGSDLKKTIRPLLSDIVLNCANRRKIAYTSLMPSMDSAIERLCTKRSFELGQRRNSSASLSHSDFRPSNEELRVLDDQFEAESYWYNQFLKGGNCHSLSSSQRSVHSAMK